MPTTSKTARHRRFAWWAVPGPTCTHQFQQESVHCGGRCTAGANQAVIEMLQAIHKDGNNYKKYIAKAKDKNDPFRLTGFGHRVYKTFDPRAKIIKEACAEIMDELEIHDPLLDIALEMEEHAKTDEYFIQRNLYPNVDFYSGIIYRAMGIPTNMFTVMFALGRLPGWIAQWTEMKEDRENARIGRPRQIYSGQTRTSICCPCKIVYR